MGHQNDDVNEIHKLACVLLMLLYIYISNNNHNASFPGFFLKSPSDIFHVLSLGGLQRKVSVKLQCHVNPHRVDVILLFYNQDLPRTLIYL